MSGARPGGAGMDAEALAALGDALDRLGASGLRIVAEAALLLLRHPHWAVWLPVGEHEWAAVRSAGSRPPGLDVPMLWVHASTAGELADKMMRAETALSGGWP